TETELTKVYNDKEFTYSVAPRLDYFNRLKSNDGYSLNEIWVLKGTDSGSTDSNDWDIYTYKEGTTSFTNTESEKTDSVIWIDDNSVIRLVYNIVDGEEILTANLYDYNITDGKLYTSPNRSITTTDDTGTVYVYTVAQGINNAVNYNKSGSKLAFGNNNTGTGLANQLWDGNTLNMANSGV
ncbi:MAG: hypothetical protein LUC94_11925, partial [Clostridiales bacterium]|nr:hypothetical protein [Clostridiales bacterium]